MKKELQNLQNKKLRGFIKQCYHHHPYYRKLMKKRRLDPSRFKKASDLRLLPITFKKDLVKDFKKFILQPDEKVIRKTLKPRELLKGLINKPGLKQDLGWTYKPTTFFGTSGRTTGMPTPSFLTSYDIELLKKYGVNDMGFVLRNMKNLIMQNTFPFAPHLAFWFTYFIGSNLPDCFYYSFGSGRTEYQVKAMEKFKATVIAGMPFYLKHFSDVAREQKVKSSVKLLMLGGERIPDGMKKKIKQNFSKIGPTPEVKMTYGSTEMKIALFECTEGSGYHIHPDLHVWEVVDKKTLEPVGPGESGLLVFSHVDFRGTVLLRYCTGDYVEGGITYGKCPHCGSHLPRINNNIQRIVDMDKGLTGTKVKGNLINLNVFDKILSKIKGLEQYRVLITKKDKKDKYSLDEIIIEVGPGKGVNVKALMELIERRIKAFTDITPELVRKSPLEIFNECMNKMKGVRIIDQR